MRNIIKCPRNEKRFPWARCIKCNYNCKFNLTHIFIYKIYVTVNPIVNLAYLFLVYLGIVALIWLFLR
jgi:hypothetical protein